MLEFLTVSEKSTKNQVELLFVALCIYLFDVDADTYWAPCVVQALKHAPLDLVRRTLSSVAE